MLMIYLDWQVKSQIKFYFGPLFLIFFLFGVPTSFSEDMDPLEYGVPKEILQRVFLFRCGSQWGTCFAIDVDNRQYILTAKHLTHSLKSKGEVQIEKNGKWIPLVVELIPPVEDPNDLVALAPNKVLVPKMNIFLGEDRMVIGQEVFFLGFPFGLSTEGVPLVERIPFVKKGIISAMGPKNQARVLYLDGHNNQGFSGGPVIYSNFFNKNTLSIAGVVAAYRTNKTPVKNSKINNDGEKKSSQEIEGYINENTGIVISYGISGTIESIKDNPIGPLIEPPVAK
jgi:hypothetical protein